MCILGRGNSLNKAMGGRKLGDFLKNAFESVGQEQREWRMRSDREKTGQVSRAR